MGKFHDALGDSGTIRPLAYRILTSAWLERFPPYRTLYARRIAARQRAGAAFPRVVAIEGTNRCNAACVMCGHKGMQRAHGVMDLALYQRLISQLQAHPPELLLLSGFGEPLLDPHLGHRISLAKRAGLQRIGIVTNASLLTAEQTDELIAAGLDLVHISLDGATPATYNRLRPGLDFDCVIGNIERLLARQRRPAVHIQVVMLRENASEKQALRRLWHGRADRLIFRPAQDWAGQVSLPPADYSPHLMRHDGAPPCRYLWDQLNVYWDGTVPACCLDFEAKQVLGDVKQETSDEVWQGGILADMRRKHNDGERDTIPLCRQCNYFSVWW